MGEHSFCIHHVKWERNIRFQRHPSSSRNFPGNTRKCNILASFKQMKNINYIRMKCNKIQRSVQFNKMQRSLLRHTRICFIRTTFRFTQHAWTTSASVISTVLISIYVVTKFLFVAAAFISTVSLVYSTRCAIKY